MSDQIRDTYWKTRNSLRDEARRKDAEDRALLVRQNENTRALFSVFARYSDILKHERLKVFLIENINQKYLMLMIEWHQSRYDIRVLMVCRGETAFSAVNFEGHSQPEYLGDDPESAATTFFKRVAASNLSFGDVPSLENLQKMKRHAKVGYFWGRDTRYKAIFF